MASDAEVISVRDALAQRVKAIRGQRGISLRDVSDRLGERGHPLDASALLRLERLERRVTIEDVLALALALDVAPIHLILPLDNAAPILLTPDVAVPAGVARMWISGRPSSSPIEGVDYDTYWRESPVAQWERRVGYHARMGELDEATDIAATAGDTEALAHLRRDRAQLQANRLRAERGHPVDRDY